MLEKGLARFTRAAEFIAAMALAAIFIIFLLQIFTRYAPKIAWLAPIPVLQSWMLALEPIGWTVNLISLMWVWLIFFGCALFVRDSEHVAFDIFYQAVPNRWQRFFSMATAIILIAVMLYSFGPTWDAIFGSRLMELKKIQTLKMPITGDRIPIKWLFASYVLLMVAVIIRYLWTLHKLIRNNARLADGDPPAPDQPSGREAES